MFLELARKMTKERKKNIKKKMVMPVFQAVVTRKTLRPLGHHVLYTTLDFAIVLVRLKLQDPCMTLTPDTD